MIHRHFQKGQILNVADLNEMIVLIDRTETAFTEVALNQWRAGLVGPPHRHDQKEQIFYVTSGKGIVVLDSERYSVKPGDIIYVPPGIEHQTIADAGQSVVYMLYNVFLNPEKEGHGTFAEHIEKVKRIRRQQADTGKAGVENAEPSMLSSKKGKYVGNPGQAKLFDFGSNTTRLLLDRTETERTELVIVTWPAGNKGAMVAHKEKEQTFFILSGSGTVTVNGENASVNPGDVVFVPRNTPHTTEAGDEELSYLCLNAYVGDMQDASFEDMYRRIAPGRIERWKKGDGSIGD